jgi:EAL domain-containing protein (putative c-di-GMP-specific phosphodiesterase class I)
MHEPPNRTQLAAKIFWQKKGAWPGVPNDTSSGPRAAPSRNDREDSMSGHPRVREVIRAAIEYRRLWHVFQPIWDVPNRRLLGFEALARFPGGTSPALVWNEAREMGQEVGRRLNIVALQSAVAAGANLPGLLFLNLSARYLGSSPSTPDGVALAAIQRHRPLSRVVLELVEDPEVHRQRAVRWVRWMQAAGVRFALDDAGTGASDASRFFWLRPQFVKVDAQVLRQWMEGEAGELRRWVRFAAYTGAAVIVEGVESLGLTNALRPLQVCYLQGFALGRPAPAEHWLRRGPFLGSVRIGRRPSGSPPPKPADRSWAGCRRRLDNARRHGRRFEGSRSSPGETASLALRMEGAGPFC